MTYEYKCNKCSTKFEVAQGRSDGSIVSCPQCHSLDTRKVISLVPVLFRGQGFYRTDHPKGKK